MNWRTEGTGEETDLDGFHQFRLNLASPVCRQRTSKLAIFWLPGKHNLEVNSQSSARDCGEQVNCKLHART